MPALGGDRKLVVKATRTPRQSDMIFWADLGDTHVSNSIFSATTNLYREIKYVTYDLNDRPTVSQLAHQYLFRLVRY